MVTSKKTVNVHTEGQNATTAETVTPVCDAIRNLADKYARELHARIEERVEDMKTDDRSHFLIYRVLGISQREGELVLLVALFNKL